MSPPPSDPAPANPLDDAVAALMGTVAPLRREDLRRYQYERLRDTVAWAQQHSPFYRRRLAGVDAGTLHGPADQQRLPFTTADELRRNDPPLLCVSQDDISHVVTLETSGTSGPPKRLFFTPEDQRATRDFFRAGMAVFTRPGDRVLVLFPGGRAGSVGDLLALALRSLGAEPLVAAAPLEPADAARLLHDFRPDVVAGPPVPVLAVARHAAALGPLRVRAALLSSDRAGPALRNALAALWRCEVHDHYGMTEMGLGGGVDCIAHAGYHMREAELLLEVVDPASGAPLPEGCFGEVVLSTLLRRGLPLIRYRTGDLSRIVPGPCTCGSALIRLDRIQGRIGAGVPVGDGCLTQEDLDEALLGLPQVIDFAARYRRSSPPRLCIDLATLPGEADARGLQDAVAALPALATTLARQQLRLELTVAADGRLRSLSGKRRIAVDNAA